MLPRFRAIIPSNQCDVTVWHANQKQVLGGCECAKPHKQCLYLAACVADMAKKRDASSRYIE